MSILEIIGLVSIVGAGLAWIFCAAGSDREVKRTKKNFPFQAVAIIMLLVSGTVFGQTDTRTLSGIKYTDNWEGSRIFATTEGHIEETTAYKNCKFQDKNYLIKYEYNASFCSVPATYPAGAPHYDARITVFQLVPCKCGRPVNDTIAIGSSFYGTYVVNGCFEDVPENHVKKALGLSDDVDQLGGGIIMGGISRPDPIGFDTLLIGTSISYVRQYDTVHVLMMVCDTAGPLVTNVTIFPAITWKRGYDVRERNDPYTIFLSTSTGEDPNHVRYLDENKVPLKETAVVWMVKKMPVPVTKLTYGVDTSWIPTQNWITDGRDSLFALRGDSMRLLYGNTGTPMILFGKLCRIKNGLPDYVTTCSDYRAFKRDFPYFLIPKKVATKFKNCKL